MSSRVGGSSVRVCLGCAMFLVVRCLFQLCDEKAWVPFGVLHSLMFSSAVLRTLFVYSFCFLCSVLRDGFVCAMDFTWVFSWDVLLVCLFVLSLRFIMFMLWLRK